MRSLGAVASILWVLFRSTQAFVCTRHYYAPATKARTTSITDGTNPALASTRHHAPFTALAMARTSTSTTTGARSGVTNSIHKVQDPLDFLDFLAKDERLCVVKVTANWCKTCKRFDIKWRKLVNQYSDKADAQGNILSKGRVRFAEIEFTENEDLCRGLQATILPNVLMFRGAIGSQGHLTNFQCGPAAFHVVIDKVSTYLEAPTPEEGARLLREAHAEDVAAKEKAKLEDEAKRFAKHVAEVKAKEEEAMEKAKLEEAASLFDMHVAEAKAEEAKRLEALELDREELEIPAGLEGEMNMIERVSGGTVYYCTVRKGIY